jgi:hypothetical protein
MHTPTNHLTAPKQASAGGGRGDRPTITDSDLDELPWQVNPHHHPTLTSNSLKDSNLDELP